MTGPSLQHPLREYHPVNGEEDQQHDGEQRCRQHAAQTGQQTLGERRDRAGIDVGEHGLDVGAGQTQAGEPGLQTGERLLPLVGVLRDQLDESDDAQRGAATTSPTTISSPARNAAIDASHRGA